MEFLPVALLRNKKTRIVKHVTVKIEICLLHKFVHLQPVFEAALLAGIMRRQAWLALRLVVGYRFQNGVILHVNLRRFRQYLVATVAEK